MVFQRRVHRIGLLLLLLVCWLAVAACGSGGNDAIDPGTIPTSAQPPTPDESSTPTSATTPTPTTTRERAGATTIILPGPTIVGPPPAGPAVFVTNDGTPRVVHLVGTSEVAMTTCLDPQCSATKTVTLADVAPARGLSHRGIGFDGDGRPMVLYAAPGFPDADPPQLPLAGALWCSDPACDAVEIRDLPEFANQGFVTSPDGRRWRAETAIGTGGKTDLRLVDCTNSYCPSTSADTVLTSSEIGFEELGITFDQDQRPAIALSGRSGSDISTLRYAMCSDSACASEPAAVTLLEGAPQIRDASGRFVDDSEYFDPQPPLFTDNGVTIVVRASGGGLPHRVLAIRCDDPTCTASAATTVFSDVGEGLATALGPDGLPRIAWTDSTGVNYSRCLTPDCSETETTSLGLTADALALTTTDSSTYIVTGITPVTLVVCPEDRCDP